MSTAQAPGSLPEITIIPLVSDRVEAGEVRSRRGRPALPSKALDIRWPKVQEFLNSNNLAPNSRKVYERELKRFLNWTELLWREIQPRHIGQYKVYLMEEATTHQGKPFAKSSVNSAIAALRSFFDWLRQAYPELLSANPARGIKFEKIPLPAAQSLTPEQMEQVWATLEYLEETKERDTALLHILSHGLRAGEVVALNVGAFDGKLLFLADTKNDEPRLVPLRRSSCEVLEGYLDWREQQGERLTPDRPLILSHHSSRKGERLSYHGIYFAIERIGKLAGIDELHPHLFRHTYATELLRQGVDPTHARRLTGHDSEKAFRRYTLRSEQEAAINAFYRAIGEAPG